MARALKRILTDFALGIIVGFLSAVIIFSFIAGLIHAQNKNKEVIKYVEIQQAIDELRKDYVYRDTFEFLDDYSSVRQAADGAANDFDRRLDEILQRFRNRLADR